MTEKQAEIVVAMAENDLNMTRAAEAVFHHYRNVVYHVSEITRRTGLDPRKFYDMMQLLPKAEAVLERRNQDADRQ